jgi:hypothetical protein
MNIKFAKAAGLARLIRNLVKKKCLIVNWALRESKGLL